MSNTLEIKTNNHWRQFLYRNEVPYLTMSLIGALMKAISLSIAIGIIHFLNL